MLKNIINQFKEWLKKRNVRGRINDDPVKPVKTKGNLSITAKVIRKDGKEEIMRIK